MMENIENYFIVYLIEVGQLHEKNTKENTEKRSGWLMGFWMFGPIWGGPSLPKYEQTRTNLFIFEIKTYIGVSKSNQIYIPKSKFMALMAGLSVELKFAWCSARFPSS